MPKERDSFGKETVPSNAYYGPSTERAKDNYPISEIKFQNSMIIAYAGIKRAAALANLGLGSLDRKISKAIVKACDEIIGGKHLDQFPIGVFQAGAGTSTNMNLNEVIANRALELMGRKRGEYNKIDPNDHVNMSQSTNDTFLSAAQIAAYSEIEKRLIPALERYQSSIDKKSAEFSKIIKSGRTHLMDAVPITLGQEFSGYSAHSEIKAIKEAAADLLALNSGGTALGTGLNTYPKFQKIFLRELNAQTGYSFRHIQNKFAMAQNITAIAETSSALKEICLKLIKVSNDIRLMSSGPHAGLEEISIPALQPGSSIMPGKVNPGMPEMLTMVCFRVIGNDSAITMAAQAGQFDLNVFSPVAVYCVLESIELLSNGIDVFTRRCLAGIKPNKARMSYYLERSPSIATALAPIIGYAKTAKLVKDAERMGIGVRELALRKRLFTKRELDKILDPKKLTKPNLPIE